MKCKYCGAEVNSEAKICPFCNSEVEKEKTVMNITNNFYGEGASDKESSTMCPQCGGRNLKFRREEIGNKKSKTSKRVYYRTVAICQSCGYTWQPNTQNQRKNHSFWWWVLVVLFYPISLTVWFIKTPKLKMEKKYRIVIVISIWLALVIIGALAPNTTTDTDSTTTSVPVSQTIDLTEEEATDASEQMDESNGEVLFTINNETLGDYGKWKTLNKGTEFEYKFIEYHVPAGKYKVTSNKKEYSTQLTVYSDDYVLNDAGWEEAAKAFDSVTIPSGGSAIITVKKGQHLKCSDGATLLRFEKAE